MVDRRSKVSPTICAQCRHFRWVGKVWAWHSFTCGMAENDRGVDFVTGEPCFVVTNDLGGRTATDQRYRYCREVNDGACVFYEKGRLREQPQADR